MYSSEPNARNADLSLSTSDIYRAAGEGVILMADAERLVKWGYEQRFRDPLPAESLPLEQRKGFNLVTVAYYFGAMLMISACAWFLGDKWSVIGSGGIFATVFIYMLIAVSVGWWVRSKGFIVGGGLLITVAVCLVPLLTYTIEDMLGIWPADHPGSYANYYPWINGSWIVMELVTIVAALFALRYVRFAFLTAPIAFSFWFLSMDLAALISRNADLSWKTRQWVSVLVGLCTLLIGYFLDRSLHKVGEPRSEDFAFWCYLFGMFAFWGGLTSMDSGSELARFVYLLLNVGLIVLALKTRRITFLIFGAVGVHLYLGHLAYTIFKDSFFFPFVIALLGLSLILVTVFAQRRLMRRTHA